LGYNDTVTITLSGEYDIASTPRLRARFATHPPAGGELLVDLRGATFIDVSTVRVLFEVEEAARREGWTLLVAVEPGPVRRLLALTGADTRLALVSDSEALAA
jgi:anti-anti-sigma factor